jgi:hypothetical protein
MYERITQRVKLVPAIAAQAAQSAGTITGVTIDRYASIPTQPTGTTAYTAVKDAAGIYNSAIIGVVTGAATGSPTAQSTTYKLQHGTASDASDMADVPAAAYIDSDGSTASIIAITANSTSSMIAVNLEGLGRYIRVVATLALTAGTTPTQFVGAFVALGDGNGNPVS